MNLTKINYPELHKPVIPWCNRYWIASVVYKTSLQSEKLKHLTYLK